ncbi:MAG: hypothetical protein WHT06_12700 [Desulfobacterales bacterium]
MIVGSLVKRLPAEAIGRVAGRVLFAFAPAARRVIRSNLAFAFPERTPAEIEALRLGVERHYGRLLVELLQMGFFEPGDIRCRVRFSGLERATRAVGLTRGFIAVSAHLGNWELGMQVLPACFGRPLTAVAKKFKRGWVENYLHRTRTRFGSRILYKKGALAEMTRIVRDGGVLAILVDMARRKDGVEVRFFGRRATATPAAAMLALRCRCPVLPVFCLHEADGTFAVRIEEPLEMLRTGDLRGDILMNTQRITEVVEKMIRRHPEQWHWLMRRWKEFHPELYARAGRGGPGESPPHGEGLAGGRGSP